MGDIVTSLRIDEDLWKKAKVYAIEHDMTMRQFLESLIKKELEVSSPSGSLKQQLREFLKTPRSLQELYSLLPGYRKGSIRKAVCRLRDDGEVEQREDDRYVAL